MRLRACAARRVSGAWGAARPPERPWQVYRAGPACVKAGGFVCSVAGKRRGKGSSREQSPYAELMAGIRVVVAESIERIYKENCQNLEILTTPDFPLLVELRRYAEEWDGTTRRDLPHFRVLAEVSRHLRDGVLRPLLAPAYEMDPTFVYTWFLAHEPAHRILETRPPHLLPAGYETWEEFLRELLREAGDAMVRGPGQLGLDTPWGQVNRARFHHPFGALHPVLGRFLNLPSDPLPGWLGAAGPDRHLLRLLPEER